MAGKPRQKVFCQSLTRRSKRPCLAKGFLCANGKYLCRFHGYNNIRKKTHFGYQNVIRKKKDLNDRKIKSKDLLRGDSKDKW